MESQAQLLYLDSDPRYLDQFSTLFENKYRLFKSSSVKESLNILQENDIQLCLLDQETLRKSDMQFLNSLMEIYPQTIQILTGDTLSDCTIQAINMGQIEQVILKPWKQDELDLIVEKAIKMHEARCEKNSLVNRLQSINLNQQFLHQISQKISEKKPLPKLLNDIMENSKLLMAAEASSLLLYDPKDKKLYFQVATGAKGKLIKKFSVAMGEGIAGWVAKHKQTLLIEDCYHDPRFNPEYDKKSDFKTKSMICVPLIRKKKLLGVIQVINKKEGGIFEPEDVTLFETLASQCAIAIENHQLTEKQIETEALERELEMARDIQENLLPKTLPEYEDINVDAKLIPARQVGGDYYTVIRINPTQSLFFVADVCGKGIPAALIVSTINAVLNSYLKMQDAEFDLMGLVTAMNQVLIECTTTTKFATAWFGLYDHTTKSMKSVNAGHNPPYLFRDNEPEPITLKKGGLFLGGMDFDYAHEHISLKKNDVLVYYTDGVTEAWNKKQEDYGKHRLIKVISKHLNKSSKGILKAIYQDVDKYVNNAPQSDDITCAVLKVL